MSLYWPPEMGDWTWDSESMIWPGGQPDELEKLWSAPTIDGEDHLQPEVQGRLSREWFIEEAQHEIPFMLSGLVMPDGSPASNVAQGVAANYRELVRKIGSPLTWSDVDVATSVTDADGVLLEGRAKGYVSPLERRRGSVNVVTITVVIPEGALFESGS